MSWNNEMVLITRYLVDDIAVVSSTGLTSTYTDERLETTILVAAQLTLFDVTFDKTYIVDVDSCSLTPDPTVVTRDNAFINLVSLKTACIILGAEAKAAATNAIKVKDGGRFGSAEIDMGQSYKALQERAATACKDYQDAKVQYLAGNGRVGAAIIGPYVNEQTNPIPGNFS